MAHWRIELLGGLRVVSNAASGQVVSHFESRKTAALLAYLALHPERAHPREELAALIWPDAEFEASRNRLKQSLASLRKLLGAGVFEADRFSVRVIAGSLITDVSEWERLVRAGRVVEASGLWRGELLPGFYDEVLLTERERLNALKEKLCTETKKAQPYPVRLPVTITRFFGRERERARLGTLLASERWVTITGPGGMGKTRLAIEIARDWNGGEVAFVPLAELGHVEGTVAAIAAALECPLANTKDSLGTLCALLKNRPSLLVLDNAEHLDGATLLGLCQQLLVRLPTLRLLVTSRQFLGGAGEVRFQLESLDPIEGATTLFLDRVRCLRPDFPDSDEVVRLCALLEGMPLAIELCAAWAGALSVPQMCERLERGDLALLRQRPLVGANERHRSVETVFLSSYERLTTSQQALLRGLTVFRGGWTLEAAEAICPTDDTLADLMALLDASLLSSSSTGRFMMLESLRRFTARLLRGDEAVVLSTRHQAWCASLMREAMGNAEREIEGLTLLDQEWANCRHAIEGAPSAESAAMTLSLELYIRLRGLGGEAIPWLERVLADPELPVSLQIESLIRLSVMTGDRQGLPTAHLYLDHVQELLARAPERRLQAALHYQRGRLLAQGGRFEEALAEYALARPLWQEQGDRENAMRALHMMGQATMMLGDLSRAREQIVEAEEQARLTKRPSLIAEILLDRAGLAYHVGDYEASLLMNEECEKRARILRHPRVLAKIWNNSGEAAMALGDEVRARRAYLDSALGICRLREWRLVYVPLWNLAHLYHRSEEYDLSLLALACGVRIMEEMNPLTDDDRHEMEALREQGRLALGAELAAHLWQQGRVLTPDEVLAQIDARPPLKHSSFRR